MKMQISAEKAAQHLVDEIEASIAAWKRDQGDHEAEVEEAVNLLAGWAHLARLPDSASPAGLRAELDAVVESEGRRMVRLILDAFDPEGWLEAVREIESLYENGEDVGSLNRIHDAGLALFLQLDEADLAAWAAVQVGDESDPALDALLGALTACNFELEAKSHLFAPARGYAQAMLSAYDLKSRTAPPDLSQEALEAITSKFETVARAAEYGNSEMLLGDTGHQEMRGNEATHVARVVPFPKRASTGKQLAMAADAPEELPRGRTVLRLVIKHAGGDWNATLIVEEPLTAGETVITVLDAKGLPVNKARLEFCGRHFEIIGGVARVDDEWLEKNWESVVTSDFAILDIDGKKTRGVRQD